MFCNYCHVHNELVKKENYLSFLCCYIVILYSSDDNSLYCLGVYDVQLQ